MVFSVLATHAQSLDKILEKHYAATGVEKMGDIKSFVINAKMSMMGMDMPMLIKMKYPKKFKVEMEMMGQKTISAFDGNKGWMINPMMGSGVQDLAGEELDKAMDQANMMEGELYNYKKKGFTAELLGKEGNDYKIKLTGSDGAVKNYFIDADTYLISKFTAKVEAMGQSVNVESKMTEYQKVEGIMIPKVTEVNMPMGTMKNTIEEVKINVAIDDAEFKRPAN
jgi:outer membrane lipoprotein-sorting protein